MCWPASLAYPIHAGICTLMRPYHSSEQISVRSIFWRGFNEPDTFPDSAKEPCNGAHLATPILIHCLEPLHDLRGGLGENG